MLSAAELAGMRAAQEAALPDTCHIRVRTKISDGQGGSTETWSTVVTACRIRPMSNEQVQRFADRLVGVSGWVITLPYGTAVALGDQVRLDGVDYEVVGTNDGESLQTALRVYATRAR